MAIGIFKIGAKATGSVTFVQVIEDPLGSSWPLRVPEYVAKGIMPSYDDLPWREDWANALAPRGPAASGRPAGRR